MNLENLLKKVQLSLNRKELTNALNCIAEIREKYPLNKRIDEFINSNKKKHIDQSKLFHEIINLQKEIRNNDFASKLLELIKLEPHNGYLYGLLGDYYGSILNFKKAKLYQEKAISLCPFEEVFYINLSKSLSGLKLHKHSLEALKLSKILKPKELETNLLIARAHIRLFNYKSAFKVYNELLLNYPNNLEISIEFCRHLLDIKETNNAIKILDQINSRQDDYNEIRILYGLVKLNQNNVKEAKGIFLDALRLEKNSSDIYTLIGLADEKLGNYFDAIKNHKKAINLDPNNFNAYKNLAVITSFYDKTEEAINYLKKSIEINPQFYEGIYYLGQLQLYSRSFELGWKNFESRWDCKDYHQKKINTKKTQLIELNKKITLFTWSEQGIGDQIMYGSMFSELSTHVGKLIVKLDKRLIPIFKDLHSDITFIGKGDKLFDDDFDHHLPFGSIGSLIRNHEIDFRRNKYPYISGDKNVTSKITKKYKKNGEILVGMSWSSSKAMLSQEKSIDLEKLLPILNFKNFNFIDLEYKDTAEERKLIFRNYGVKIHKEESINNFSDIIGLTSIIDACDFVITCSNVNAHICGALNKKTFLLLPFGRGRLWNWNKKNEKSFWYPSINILQNNNEESWDYPIKTLKERLKNE